MADKKGNKRSSKKSRMSEGTAITVVVLGFTAGGIAAYYILKWIVGFFFPDLLN